MFITTAIDIIYHIYDIIKIKDSQDNITLDIQLFNQIKQEYDLFIKNLHSNIDKINSLLKNIKNDSLVQLKQFLVQKTFIKKETLNLETPIKNIDFICNICQKKVQ